MPCGGLPGRGRRLPRRAWTSPGTRGDPCVSPSELVRLLRQIVRQRARHAARIVHLDDVPRDEPREVVRVHAPRQVDRKSTRLNSSHSQISYAVFCLKKKNNTWQDITRTTS